jgi:hypothetical protein
MRPILYTGQGVTSNAACPPVGQNVRAADNSSDNRTSLDASATCQRFASGSRRGSMGVGAREKPS